MDSARFTPPTVTCLTCLALVALSAPARGDELSEAEVAERVYLALDEAQRLLPRDSFDPQAVIETIGRDPVELFRWVRDRTAWVPYRGALRGPVGVVMDRRGNSLDRALLLAELLRSTGRRVRLARCVLPAEEAAALLERIRSVAPPSWPPAVLAIEESLSRAEARASKLGLDAKELREAAESMASLASRSAARAGVWVDSLSQVLVGTKVVERVGRGDVDDTIEDLRDHWWTQMLSGSEWTDLDPLLPDASPGERLAEAEETVPMDRCDQRLPPDGKWNHEVVVRIVIEQLREGVLKEQIALEHVLRPAELIGARVVLTHLPVEAPAKTATGGDEPTGEEYQRGALAVEEWLPLLSLGRQVLVEKSFNARGELNDTPQAAAAGKLANSRGRASGGLGTSLGGGEEKGSEAEQGTLTAEWLDFEIRSPGGPARTARSVVFDCLGPAARRAPGSARLGEPQRSDRALRLSGEVEILFTVCDFPDAFVDQLATRRLLDSKTAYFPELQSPEDVSRDPNGDSFWELSPGPLYELAMKRVRWGRSGGRVFHDAPNVLLCQSWLRVDSEKGLVLQETIDMAVSRVGLWGGSSAEAPKARLVQGVVDGVAETLALPETPLEESTAGVFATRASAGALPLVLETLDDLAPRRAALPADVAERIEQSLSEGFLVVLPASGVPTAGGERWGWWQIDPSRGDTVGVMDNGRRGSLSEEGILQRAMPYLNMNKRAAVVRGYMAYRRARRTQELLGIGAAWGALLYKAWSNKEARRQQRRR